MAGGPGSHCSALLVAVLLDPVAHGRPATPHLLAAGPAVIAA